MVSWIILYKKGIIIQVHKPGMGNLKSLYVV